MGLRQWFFNADDGHTYSATARVQATKMAVTVRDIRAIATQVDRRSLAIPEIHVPVAQEFQVTRHVRAVVEAALNERIREADRDA